MTFAFNAASSTNDATSTTRTVDLTGWMSPAAGDAIIVWAGGRGTANTLSFTPSGGGGGAGGACVGMPIVRVEEGVSR